jgi:hypothetical protein
METPPRSPPGTPKASGAGGAPMGYAGRPNMANAKQRALNVRKQRNELMAMRALERDPNLGDNKVLVNLTTGYVDPSVAHMFRGVKGGPRVVPKELLQTKFPGWGAIGAAAPKAHPFGVRPGASMGAWGSGGPPVSMDMGAAGGEQQAPSGLSTVVGSAYASEASDEEGFPNNNPKAPNGKRRKTEENKQGGGRRKTRKGGKSRKMKKLKTRSKRK